MIYYLFLLFFHFFHRMAVGRSGHQGGFIEQSSICDQSCERLTPFDSCGRCLPVECWWDFLSCESNNYESIVYAYFLRPLKTRWNIARNFLITLSVHIWNCCTQHGAQQFRLKWLEGWSGIIHDTRCKFRWNPVIRPLVDSSGGDSPSFSFSWISSIKRLTRD